MRLPPHYIVRSDGFLLRPSPAKQLNTMASKLGKRPGCFRGSYLSELSGDDATASLFADELRRLRELVKTIPDTRQDKIDAIKKQIESGTYNVPGESVVESIIEFIKDELSKIKPQGY